MNWSWLACKYFNIKTVGKLHFLEHFLSDLYVSICSKIDVTRRRVFLTVFRSMSIDITLDQRGFSEKLLMTESNFKSTRDVLYAYVP